MSKYKGIMDEQEALAAVQQDGYALRYVHKQTYAICKAAVQQDGYALQYVREQTEEICLAAVQEEGSALEWIRDISMYDKIVAILGIA